jgi:hypothetical protein
MLVNFKGKILFCTYLITWILIVLLLWIYWREIPAYISWPISIMEMIFAPDIKSIKILFCKGEQDIER